MFSVVNFFSANILSVTESLNELCIDSLFNHVKSDFYFFFLLYNYDNFK